MIQTAPSPLPSVPLPRLPRAEKPSSREPVASADTDAVLLQSPPPPSQAATPALPSFLAPVPSPPPGLDANPWPQLERLGLLATGAAVTGPIGQVLDATAREGLRQAVQRIDAAGIGLLAENGWMPQGFGDLLMRSVTPDEFATALLAEKRFFEHQFGISVEGLGKPPVRSLDDLRCLDAVYGLGPQAAGPDEKATQALLSLASQGWTFRTEYASSRMEKQEGPYPALAMLRWGMAILAQPPGSGAPVWLRRARELALLDYFQGSGRTDHLDKPGLAPALHALQQKGYCFGSSDEEPRERNAWNQAQQDEATFRVGRPGGVLLKVAEKDLSDLPALEQRVAEAQHLYEAYGKAALEQLPLGTRQRHAFVDRVRSGSLVPGQPPSFCAEVLASLLHATRSPRHQPLETAVAHLQALARRLPDPEALRTEVLWFGNLLRSGAAEAKDESLCYVRDRLCLETGTPERYGQVQAALLKLTQSFGDLDLALEGLDLAQIPVTNERLEDRVELLRQLGTGARDGRQALRAYQRLAAHRLPDENMLEAAQHFNLLKESLRGARQEDLALEIFVRLQERARTQGGVPALDEAVRRFVSSVALNADVEAALQSLDDPGHGKRPAPAGQVRREDDGTLVIGGVRVPARPGP